MSQALIDAVAERAGWARIEDEAALKAWLDRPGAHCLFLPGDPAKNLESGDVAVILPEIAQAFQGAFDVALIGDAVERGVRERAEVWPTPSLIFLFENRVIGAIPRVRDWDDYMARTREILSAALQAAQ